MKPYYRKTAVFQQSLANIWENHSQEHFGVAEKQTKTNKGNGTSLMQTFVLQNR